MSTDEITPETFPYPFRRKWPSKEVIAAECAALYARREDVRNLVDATRRMAEGTAGEFDHPGFLARRVKASSAVQRLLVSLGAQHVRACYPPELQEHVRREASVAVRRWDEGDAVGDLLEEWEEAIERCRHLCVGAAGGYRTGPFTRKHVREVMKGTSTWVNDIKYGYITKLLLAEADEHAKNNKDEHTNHKEKT